MSEYDEELDCDDKKPLTELLRQQSIALDRAIRRSGKSVSEVAKILGVHRQTVHQWKNGTATIPERKLFELADVLRCEPAELRYDLVVFNKEDLMTCVTKFEEYVSENGIILTPQERGFFISRVYSEYQDLKRIFDRGFAQSTIADRIKDIALLNNLKA